MSKRALKKRRAELEALLVDRYEALGEVVLGMYAGRKWDDQILARGAAEVREVITEIESLEESDQRTVPTADDTGDFGGAAVDTGEPESRADHLFAETAEHRIEEEGKTDTADDAGPAPTEGGEPVVEESADDQPETERKRDVSPPQEAGSGEDSTAAEPAGPEVADEPEKPVDDRPIEVADTGSMPRAKPETAAPTESPEVEPGDQAETGPTEPTSPAPLGTEGQGRDLGSVELRIDQTEREAKMASEAARAALQADSKTELSAITRAIEGEQASLDRALEVAAKRIHEAEREAENARARLARELASTREAAASWVRNQAEEIEADAALAQEMASSAYEGEASGLGGDAGEARIQAMESEITSLRANLEAEKASKAEALAKAEVRVREIETAAREAERKVDEARKWAPEEARLEEKRAQEAELREAAVLWLRGQVAAVREQGNAVDEADDRPGEEAGG